MRGRKNAESAVEVEWWRYLVVSQSALEGAACDEFVLVQDVDVASGRVTVAETRL
jgi:hypothetical protein